MLRLKNVSKFYYNKGIIATGFSKVNVEFNIGEFVAIVGESGSGKSTLLNVISGLDSYEEGEMYIDGCETSHYRESDFEEYRKKYVSNIFQNFNLVNSYTVYQNIELVLLLNGYKKKEIKEKVLELIDKVKLSKYKNTKVSKLSGGQKQRVAIARALAKETPIIVCDEPTGNLDSKSASAVIKLLKEISKEKLVIIVTHNLSEVENIVTRVIRMHDGKIISDKKTKDIDLVEKQIIHESKNIGIFNMIRLGIRNTFNIIPKFLLMFMVFLFVVVSLLTVYGSLRKSEYEEGKLGYNYYFNDTTDTRIIIKKKDGNLISSSELDVISKLENVKYTIENDIILDYFLWFESLDNNPFNFGGYLRGIESFSGKLDYGRMPEEDNEVVLLTEDYDYYFGEKVKEALGKVYYYNAGRNSFSVSVVGVKYIDSNNFNYQDNFIYASNDLINEYMAIINKDNSIVYINSNGKKYRSYNAIGDTFDIRVSDRVEKGKAYVSEELNFTCKDFTCSDKSITIDASNLYYNDSINLKISQVYDVKNVKKILGINKDDIGYGSIYINSDDYNNLFNKGSYQSSVFANHVDDTDMLERELQELGYDTLQIRKTLNNDGGDVAKVIKIVKLVVIIFLVITLFFISYFVIKLILKSRNVYFSTLRILGANYKHIKKILDIELFVNSSLAYLLYVLVVYFVSIDVLEASFVKNIIDYLSISDYILMYVILIVMSYLISSRFSSKIFKNSAMNSYREEV